MGLVVAPHQAAPASSQGCDVLEALAACQQAKLDSNNFSFIRKQDYSFFHLLAYACENTKSSGLQE